MSHLGLFFMQCLYVALSKISLSLSSSHWGKKYITISEVQDILFPLNFQGEKVLKDTNLQNLEAESHLFQIIEIKSFLPIV